MDGPAEIIETKTDPDPSVIQGHDKAMSFLSQNQNLDRHAHSLLAEYVTGIPMESYKELAKMMLADKQIFRDKYQLPDEILKFSDPKHYIKILQGIAQKHNLTIRPSSEYKHSADIPLANGSLYDDKTHTIYLKPDSGPNDLEHELIHGLQDASGENLVIEKKEYEAYGCAVNAKRLTDPEWQKDIIGIFWGAIGAVSVEAHYKGEGLTNPWTVPTPSKSRPRNNHPT